MRVTSFDRSILSLKSLHKSSLQSTVDLVCEVIDIQNVDLMIQSGVHHAMNPDPYRGVFGSDGEKYAKDVQDLIDFGTSGNIAGFISEAIQVNLLFYLILIL